MIPPPVAEDGTRKKSFTTFQIVNEKDCNRSSGMKHTYLITFNDVNDVNAIAWGSCFESGACND